MLMKVRSNWPGRRGGSSNSSAPLGSGRPASGGTTGTGGVEVFPSRREPCDTWRILRGDRFGACPGDFSPDGTRRTSGRTLSRPARGDDGSRSNRSRAHRAACATPSRDSPHTMHSGCCRNAAGGNWCSSCALRAPNDALSCGTFDTRPSTSGRGNRGSSDNLHVRTRRSIAGSRDRTRRSC